MGSDPGPEPSSGPVAEPSRLRSLASKGARALLTAAFLTVVVSSFTFLLFDLLPSDPIRVTLGPNATDEAVTRLRHELGYDRPLLSRLGIYMLGVARLDFGQSLVTRRPVVKDVLDAYVTTLMYVGLALSISIVGSITLLGLARIGGGRLQSLLLLLTRAVISLPSVVVAIGVGVAMLAVLDPAVSYLADTRTAVMAGLTLAVYPTLSLTEILVLEGEVTLRLPYVRAARSFGFTERYIFWAYVFRSAMLPWLAQLSNLAASLVTGSILVELIFSLSGLGRLVLQSVLRNDSPMMQSVVIVGVLTFLCVNSLTAIALRNLYPATR